MLQMSYWTLVESSESKTEVYESLDNPERILLQSKDRIIAGNAYGKNHLEGNAANSNKHSSCIFQLLLGACIKTAFTWKGREEAIVAPYYEMILTEWVCQRIQLVLERNLASKKDVNFTHWK